ncbi:hypothetical protein KY289_036426 [Solanum tuberosum]|nr:hypothetical protein KY289_036426 [Solanum tuberosum]
MEFFTAPIRIKNWLSTLHAIVRGDEHYFIELIGLKGGKPYAPLRILHQFGRTQVIPLRSNMDQFKYDFESDNPRVHKILRRWDRVVTIVVGARRAFCTLEYYIWIFALSTSSIVSVLRGKMFKSEPESTKALVTTLF